MTNKEKYKEQIFEIACEASRCALVNGVHNQIRLQTCASTSCSACLFDNNGGCSQRFIEWLEEEAVEFDWSKVEVDTKVLVSHDNKTWSKAHFAFYDVEDGGICVFSGGKTSFTNKDCTDYEYYSYAKLYDPEVDE